MAVKPLLMQLSFPHFCHPLPSIFGDLRESNKIRSYQESPRATACSNGMDASAKGKKKKALCSAELGSHPWWHLEPAIFSPQCSVMLGLRPRSARGPCGMIVPQGSIKPNVGPLTSGSNQQSGELGSFATILKFLILTPSGCFRNSVYEPTNTQEGKFRYWSHLAYKWIKFLKQSSPEKNIHVSGNIRKHQCNH